MEEANDVTEDMNFHGVEHKSKPFKNTKDNKEIDEEQDEDAAPHKQ